jgi:hypothetical protein
MVPWKPGFNHSPSCSAYGAGLPSRHHNNGLFLTGIGGQWTARSAPLPTVSPLWGTNVTVTGLSCGEAYHCVAIGGGEGDSLIWSDRGGAWSVTTPPPKPSARYQSLSGVAVNLVSCPSLGACLVAGQFYTGTRLTRQHVLLLHGYGKNWKFTDAPGPQGFAGTENVSPRAASCSTASSCFVVGTADHLHGHFAAFTLLNGHWKMQIIALPRGGVGNATYAIDGAGCISAASCLAVGLYSRLGPRSTAYHRPLLLRLADGRWSSAAGPMTLSGIEDEDLTNVAAAGSQYVILGDFGGGDLYIEPLIAEGGGHA